MDTFGFRLLSEKDHYDLHLMAQSGRKWADVFKYANRPEDEVRRYIEKNCPAIFKRLNLNEKAPDTKTD